MSEQIEIVSSHIVAVIVGFFLCGILLQCGENRILTKSDCQQVRVATKGEVGSAFEAICGEGK